MGEKQEKDKKNDEGEKKKDGGVITVVLKFDMHCEGCAKKVRKSLKNFEGVESVKTDCAANKLVVIGKVNPTMIKERVEEKTKKAVELVSPLPSKAAKEGGNVGGGDGGAKKSSDKKPEEKSEGKLDEKKSEEKKEKPKEPSVSTVQLKTRVHCEGCANKIKKIVSKCEGVQDVNVDLQKDLIVAKGTMNMKDLLPYLNSKLKRTVDLAPTKKDNASGGDKKPNDGGTKSEKPKESGREKKEVSEDNKEGGGEMKKGDTGGDTSSTNDNNISRVEVSKMEYNPFSYDYGYAPFYDPRQQGQSYGHQVAEYWNAPEYSHPPQMFSDENPNACSVM